MIKLSVIIPIYNREKYIKKCLESIKKQSLKEIEIICINDGSTDDSLRILSEEARLDNRIKIINQNNKGASAARNAGIKEAKGEYCLNIDSDDWISDDYFKDMYNYAKNNELDILISDIIFEYTEKNKKSILKDLKIDNNFFIDGKEYINIFLEENFYGFSWNKMVKRKLYIENNILFNENIFAYEDVELILRLAYYAKKIGKLNKAYYHYLQGENNSVTKKNLKNLIDINNSFNSLITFFSKNNEVNIVKKIKERKQINIFKRLYYDSTKDMKKKLEYINIEKEHIKEILEDRRLIKRYPNESGAAILGVNLLKIYFFPKKLAILIFKICKKKD